MSRGTPTSPYTLYSTDDRRGHAISIVVAFDNATKALLSATLTRDPLCGLTKIHIGLGADGRPENSAITFPAPAGAHTVSSALLAVVGLHTLDDVLTLQITAS